MGDTGIVSHVDSGASRSAQLQGAPSLRELRYVFGRDKNRALVLAVEAEPAVVQRFIYHAEDGPDHDLFAGHYDPDPNYARQEP